MGEIAHRYLILIGRPQARESARPMQTDQTQRLMPIDLDPVGGFTQDQAWCHHEAVVAHGGHLTMNPMTTGLGFETNAQYLAIGQELVHQAFDRSR